MRITAVLALVIATVVVGPAGARPSTTPSVVNVSALSSGLKFNTTTLRAHPGKIKLVFTNQSAIKHDVRIESGEHELGGTKVIGKGQAIVFVSLKKGTYNFYCSVPGHEDAGTKGKLIVS